jgi:hypothetical protein
MKIKVYIEKAPDGWFSAYMDDVELPYDCVGQGQTIDETKEDFIKGYNEMKAYYAEIGKPFVELEFEFCYDVASFLNYYSQILSLAGLSRLTGINQGQLSHYLNGRKKPSAKTVEKIERHIHEFANELATLKLS